jgi:hypothetical protein
MMQQNPVVPLAVVRILSGSWRPGPACTCASFRSWQRLYRSRVTSGRPVLCQHPGNGYNLRVRVVMSAAGRYHTHPVQRCGA